MHNRTWSFFDPATGALSGRIYSGPPESLAMNTPEGFEAVEGQHDHLSRRVDLAQRAVIDWKPPKPSDDHEWDSDSRRWQLSAAAQEVVNTDAQARRDIAAVEASSWRTLREALLGDAAAVARLKTYDDQIAEHRTRLKK